LKENFEGKLKIILKNRKSMPKKDRISLSPFPFSFQSFSSLFFNIGNFQYMKVAKVAHSNYFINGRYNSRYSNMRREEIRSAYYSSSFSVGRVRDRDGFVRMPKDMIRLLLKVLH